MSKPIAGPVNYAISYISSAFVIGLVCAFIPLVGIFITLICWMTIVIYPFNHKSYYEEYVKKIQKENEEEEVKQWKHKQDLITARRAQ
jgi:hypothetical protein